MVHPTYFIVVNIHVVKYVNISCSVRLKQSTFPECRTLYW